MTPAITHKLNTPPDKGDLAAPVNILDEPSRVNGEQNRHLEDRDKVIEPELYKTGSGDRKAEKTHCPAGRLSSPGAPSTLRRLFGKTSWPTGIDFQRCRGRKRYRLRHQVRRCLSEEEKTGAVDIFFTLVKEELDVVPAKAQVIEYLQEKAVFVERPDNNTLTTRRLLAAKQPAHPLNKCIASIGTLSWLLPLRACPSGRGRYTRKTEGPAAMECEGGIEKDTPEI